MRDLSLNSLLVTFVWAFFLCSMYWKLFVQTDSGVARLCGAWNG